MSHPKVIILALHCTMCTLGSIFSFRPNKLRHIWKVASWWIIQHMFVSTCSVGRKTWFMRKPWVPNSKSVISLKICPCIHVFFLLYRIQGHFDYRAIVLPKLHIVQWQCLTVFFATKPPIYFSTIAVCLNASCSCTVWRKSLISDRRSLIDWSPAGCLHPSPFQPPPPASQLIDCYKVFAPSRSLSRPLLSETVFHVFLS